MIDDPEDPSSVLVSLFLVNPYILHYFIKYFQCNYLKSGPIFVPMKSGEDHGFPPTSSTNDGAEEGGQKSVRFNGVVEVLKVSVYCVNIKIALGLIQGSGVVT